DLGRLLRANGCDDGRCLRAVRAKPVLVVHVIVCNGVAVGGASSRGRGHDNFDVMVIDDRAVSVAAWKGYFWRDGAGVCRVNKGVPAGITGLFYVEKTLAVTGGNDDSTDRWGNCVASVGLWLAAKSNVLARVGCGRCPAVSGS